MSFAAEAQREWQAGNVNSARAYVNQALSIRDDVAEIYILRGRIEASENSPDAAFRAFNAALALDRVNVEALRGVAQFGLQNGNAKAAFAAADQLLLINPNDLNGIFVQGVRALFRRDYNEALARAERLIAEQPQADLPAILKARSLFMLNRRVEALQALEGYPESESVQLTRLEIFREEGDAQAMFEIFAALREGGHENSSLFLDEAHLNFKAGSSEKANSLLIAALTQEQSSEEEVRKALLLWAGYGFPSNRVLQPLADEAQQGTRLLLANALVEDGRLDIAQDISDHLGLDDRRSIEARSLVRSRQAARALRIANDVLENDETHCSALIARAEALNGTDSFRDGLIAAQQGASECPRAVFAWIVGAEAYEGLGKSAGVLRMFRQGIDVNPQSLVLTERYTRWLLGEGKEREAVSAAARLTLRTPSLSGAWQNYLRVCRRVVEDCEADALLGLERSKRNLGMDRTPEEKLRFGLFGRFDNSS